MRSAMFLLTVLIVLSAPPCFAEDPLSQAEAIRNTVGTTMKIQKKNQKTEAGWADEQTKLETRYTALEQKKSRLETRLARLERLLHLEQEKQAEGLRKKAEADRIRNELSSYLESVLSSLEEQAKGDLPFLTEERHARFDSLKALLVDPAESAAEKFRRVFEALQIEAEYGNTIETVQKNIDLDGKETLVDLFRLGRVSLFFLSMDKQKAGYFDPAAKVWKALPKSANDALETAIAMARLERTVDLVKLPLGRIVKP
ncbi:MAG: DUF3450 domain-containing protein [Desulfobacteraceae bacterium]|nr:DUF3450 domain-containing protein [Desulfobacteraceae bacterium]